MKRPQAAENQRENRNRKDLDDFLQLLLDSVLETLQGELGSVMLLDRNSGELLIQVARGLSREVVAKARQKLGKGASGWVAATGEWLELKADASHPAVEKRRRDLSSAVVIPLKNENEVLGTLNISRKSGEINLDAARRERVQKLLKTSSRLINKLRQPEQENPEFLELQRKFSLTRIFNSTRETEKLQNLTLSLSLDLLGSEQGLLTILADYEQGHESFAARGLVGHGKPCSDQCFRAIHGNS